MGAGEEFRQPVHELALLACGLERELVPYYFGNVFAYQNPIFLQTHADGLDISKKLEKISP